MSYQFVNVDPGKPDHDSETRKRIRSQAMRDYCRRRRMEEGFSPSSTVLAPPEDLPDPDSYTEILLRCTSRRGVSPVAHPDARPGDVPRRSSDGDKGKTAQRLRPSRPQLPPRSGTINTFSVDPPSSSASQVAESNDASDQPGRFQQMLNVCEQYHTWLLGDKFHQNDLFNFAGPWDKATSQMIWYALTLRSVGHLDALNASRTSCDCRLLKTMMLALCNRRLCNPTKALEDKTLGALACLASYEISRGSTEAAVHLTGMSHIIELRGGTATIAQRDLALFLEILDLMHAVYFGTTAMYTRLPRPIHMPAVVSQSNSTERVTADALAFEEFTNFVLDLQDVTEMGAINGAAGLPLPEPSVSPTCFEQEVRQWYQYLIHAGETMTAEQDEGISRICQLTARLHLAATNRDGPSASDRRPHCDEIINRMTNVADKAWLGLRGLETLYIRLLLTTMAAAVTVPHKSWCHAYLTRQLYRVEQEGWSEMKGLVLGFINMQAAARKSQLRARLRAVEWRGGHGSRGGS